MKYEKGLKGAVDYGMKLKCVCGKSDETVVQVSYTLGGQAGVGGFGVNGSVTVSQSHKLTCDLREMESSESGWVKVVTVIEYTYDRITYEYGPNNFLPHIEELNYDYTVMTRTVEDTSDKCCPKQCCAKK